MGQNLSSEKETERDQNDMFHAAVSECQGWRASQEDSHSLMLNLPGDHKASFFAVFDGHGSAKVSKHASDGLWRHLVGNAYYSDGNFKQALEQAFLDFDSEVNVSLNAQLAGTTAICVLIVDNIIYCANIGDSRAVASINCECMPLSYDHKPDNPQELRRILAAGGYVIGNRVNGNLALSRAFGDFYYKGNCQLEPSQQIVSTVPDIKTIELNDDVDFIVLACDGIWDVLYSEDVVEFVISRLESQTEPGKICEELTDRCLAPDHELVIGCDNMTVLLVCYTRGRTWEDYCKSVAEKNSKRPPKPATSIGFDDPNLAPIYGRLYQGDISHTTEEELLNTIASSDKEEQPNQIDEIESESTNEVDGEGSKARESTNEEVIVEVKLSSPDNDSSVGENPAEKEDESKDTNKVPLDNDDEIKTASAGEGGGGEIDPIVEKSGEVGQLDSTKDDEKSVQSDDKQAGQEDEIITNEIVVELCSPEETPIEEAPSNAQECQCATDLCPEDDQECPPLDSLTICDSTQES